MHQSLAPFSGPETLGHARSLADFITATSGFRFLVHTACMSWLLKRSVDSLTDRAVTEIVQNRVGVTHPVVKVRDVLNAIDECIAVEASVQSYVVPFVGSV